MPMNRSDLTNTKRAVRKNRGQSSYHLHVQSAVQYQSVSCCLVQHVMFLKKCQIS